MKRIAAVRVFALVALLVGPSPASALQFWYDVFVAQYPSSVTATNAGCAVCHLNPEGGGVINAYGKDWATIHNMGFLSGQAFTMVESMNSDGNPGGATNITEINAGTQPGWTVGAVNTVYDENTLVVAATNQTAPPQIIGSLDPGVPPAPPVLLYAASRKTHGAAGPFDLALSLVAPPTINHNPTTEPRTGPVQTIVMIFAKPVVAGSASLDEGIATLGTPTFSGIEMTVPLTGVSDKQYVTVSVSNVTAADGGAGGSGSARVGFLAGNVTQTRKVLPSDVGVVRAHLLQIADLSNFLFNVTGSGQILPSDASITRINQLHSLSTP